MLKIEKEVIIKVKDDEGNELHQNVLVMYTTKSNPCATAAYYMGLTDKGLVEFRDYIADEVYTKTPSSIMTIKAISL